MAVRLTSFVRSFRIVSSDALSRLKSERNTPSNVCNSASADAETSVVPTVIVEALETSAIHEGNPPMVPSGNSQKIYSP
jgi:hypothetical protein